MILYLHGFNSSSKSSKAQLTVRHCAAAGLACVAPDLPHRPAAAIELARACCARATRVVVVGSSLGGYYATWLVEHGHAAHAVLVNPAVAVAAKLADEVGKEQQNYSSAERYVFDSDHLRELEGLAVGGIADPSRYLLLAQEGDEVLDYREAVEFYAGSAQVIEPGGDHGFVDFARHLPAIAALAAGPA